MFSCRDATELMTDEGEGALRGGRRALFRLHMFICGHCRAFRRQVGDAVTLAKEIPTDELPPDAEHRLVEAFRARRR
jgi:predicted anti-sigma-YlaC factor YlaD